MSRPALRFYKGKPPLDLIDPDFEVALANVMAYGGRKYGDPLNYKRGMAKEYYIASAKRHINGLVRGETHDAESGCHHAAMAAWNMMALYHNEKAGVFRKDTRWRKPK